MTPWRKGVRGAWACVVYLPVGLQYTTFVVGLAVSLRRLAAQRALARVHEAAPGLQWAGLLVAWLWASALWSPAAAVDRWTHAGNYSVLLALPYLAAGLRREEADRALAAIAGASAVVALLFMLEHAAVLPPSIAWHTTVHATGNQRIATSLLLAAGGCLALWRATLPGLPPRRRAAWGAVAALALLGLALQDRRSGMVVLPLVLLVWGGLRLRSGRARATAAAALVIALALTWLAADGVRQRFHEGLAELRQRPADRDVATSWGQRKRMAEITAAMVAERPLAGHGLGSWELLWHQRTPPGSALAAQRTPHSEVLLLAQQAGLPALALFAALVVAQLRAARAAGVDGTPLLVAWVTIAVAAAFNAIIRDAKFALPLLLLAALGAARARPAAAASTP